ncbi:hypothetical protein RRG08_014063 [Elysia crispata]|uniref:Uncharacterized protein n=1 Tax=Elysia crispata TaxID=231223 RepID=A0AAE1A0S6_9GAST|nr:hypothetical protein RRG08_014063 [Elysia crispata]
MPAKEEDHSHSSQGGSPSGQSPDTAGNANAARKPTRKRVARCAALELLPPLPDSAREAAVSMLGCGAWVVHVDHHACLPTSTSTRGVSCASLAGTAMNPAFQCSSVLWAESRKIPKGENLAVNVSTR